jgi:hypothetical protein
VMLKELRVYSSHSQPAVKGSDLAWLVSHSPTSLEILHLYDLVLEPSMSEFMCSISEQLQSLHITSSLQSDLIELPAWLRLMNRLKELIIGNDVRSADLPGVMEALPSTIQHLGFAVRCSQGLP